MIAIAAVVGGLAYILFGDESQSSETIKIGVCADLDALYGQILWQEVVLAAEQVNADGGVLGRKFEVFGADDDSMNAIPDTTIATNALTRLIAVDKVDFLLTSGILSSTYQEIVSQHKIIMLDGMVGADELTQKVLDDYDKYKYYFRIGLPNSTSSNAGVLDSIMTLKDYTGFNKIGYVTHDTLGATERIARYTDTWSENGFDVVYTTAIPLDAFEFSSYFARAEAAGAEILYCTINGPACVPFVKEYSDRQSPMILSGLISMVSDSNFWNVTDGKCEFVSSNTYPTVVGYPLTSKTASFREAYIERWGEDSLLGFGPSYDAVRYILPDAIRRAGTTETEAVIKALETVDVETSLARHFVFTSSHDIMIGEAGPNKPSEDYFLICIFQWQNGELVPIYPKEIMEEAGATYTYPDWPGPWDE